MRQSIRIGIDIGGTFTDVALEVDGQPFSTKVLTTHGAPEDGVVEGLRAIMATARTQPGDVSLLIHGTTLATNALIERKGARTGLLTTEGFRDLLEIRSEDRYEQYDLSIVLPDPLVPRRLRLGVPERIDARGGIRIPLDTDALRRAAQQFLEAGVEAVAVGFLNAHINSAHEREAERLLRELMPNMAISLSHEISPEMREYERFSTAAANAYVQPLIAGYLDRLAARLDDEGYRCPMLLMLSGGGLATVDTAKRYPVRLVESGPAGGAAFAADIAARHGLAHVFSFDMGGTTAKLCLIDNGLPQTSRSFEVARVWRFARGSGLPLRIPVIEMVEIGAGGGSLAVVDELGRISVGPESSGSEPGPACYGLGGAGATVTDADLIVGRIDAEDFAGGSMRLDTIAAAAAVDGHVGGPLDLETQLAALGIVEMVEETMASAARVHSIEQGAEIGQRSMVAFGGAGPMHAIRMAEKLGIGRVLVPRQAGVGSAIGFLRAPVAYQVMRTWQTQLVGIDEVALASLLSEAESEALAVVASATSEPVETERMAYMRYEGQGHEIEVALPGSLPTGSALAKTLTTLFERTYEKLYGRGVPNGRIEAMAWSVLVRARGQKSVPVHDSTAPTRASTEARREIIEPATGTRLQAPVFRRKALPLGAGLTGPAVIVEDETSIFVPEGWYAQVGPEDILDCQKLRENAATSPTKLDTRI